MDSGENAQAVCLRYVSYMSAAKTDIYKSYAFIGGRWVGGDAGRSFAVSNPADGAVLATLPDLGPAEAEQAIVAADKAFAAWSGMTAAERSDILYVWYQQIVAHKGELAELITAEQGKPLRESRGEVDYGAAYVRWYAEEARRTYGEVIPTDAKDRRLITVRQPVGVVAAITPWNFPLAMVTRKIAPALAAGCTVVLKPAEATPLTALALAALGEASGIPAGVFNVLTAAEGAAVGKALCASPTVRKLSFTGSTAVGKLLFAQCAPTVKRLSLELGGHAPFIVFDDADVDAAVEGAIQAKFRNAGQTCVCANRFYIHESVLPSFAKLLQQRMSALNVGAGRDDNTDIGPLISEAAVAKVESHVSDALERGAEVLLGGGRHEAGGTWFEPTLLAGVSPDSLIMTEETFGPLVALTSFSKEADVIELANATTAGLAAYFYSRDIGRIWRTAEALEYGMVGINTGLLSSEVIPFGGTKESGLGREGARAGIDEYLETKYLCIAGLDNGG